MKGFRDFLMQGNLLELAVAVIIGAAFGEVVKTLSAVIMGIIGLGFQTPNFADFQPMGLPVGVFINAVLAFLLAAAIVYFVIIKPVQAIRARMGGAKDEAALTTEDLLTQIRDLLARRA